MKKNKMINAASCDARAVTEESLAGYENITINAAILIVNERSKELLNKMRRLSWKSRMERMFLCRASTVRVRSARTRTEPVFS